MGEKHKYGMQVTLGSFLLPTAINHINVWPHQQHPENAKKNRVEKAKQRRQLNISHQLLVQLSGNVDGPFLIYSYDNAGIRQ